ncbi:MAG: 4Fe-4S binding protein [Myxococcota bacterium]
MKGLLDALRISGLTLFRPMTTEPLPWHGKRAHPERFRATFALVLDEHGEQACIGCRMCEKICPSQIITVTTGPKAPSAATGKARGWASDFTLDLNACIGCELCVQVCPTDAIVMCREPQPPGYAREDLLLTMERLYANEKLRGAGWANATKLLGMQEPAKAEAPPKAEVAK